jgi:hypothetical protein
VLKDLAAGCPARRRRVRTASNPAPQRKLFSRDAQRSAPACANPNLCDFSKRRIFSLHIEVRIRYAQPWSRSQWWDFRVPTIQRRLIAARAAGKPFPPPFSYRHYGELAIIGRGAAIVKLGRLELRGLLGWLFWSGAHIYFLIGTRNRLVVAISWAWSYITYQRGARLITTQRHDAPTRHPRRIIFSGGWIAGCPHVPSSSGAPSGQVL